MDHPRRVNRISAGPVVLPAPATSRVLSARHRACSGSAAALASVAFHALVVLPAVWGSAAPKTRLPDQQGAGSSAMASDEEPTETLILVNIPGPTSHFEQHSEHISSRGFAPRDLLITLASPDVTPAVDLSRAITTESREVAPTPAADQAVRRAQLLGMYVGQVKARIERAWLRPRAAITGGVFSCNVTIRQDKRGSVERVVMRACNGGDDWQRSLESAIRAASPMSAPPDPSVFATSLSLSFVAKAFVPGQAEDGYESEHPTILASRVSQVVHDGVLELRITGVPISQAWQGSPSDSAADEVVPKPTSTMEGPDLSNGGSEF